MLTTYQDLKQYGQEAREKLLGNKLQIRICAGPGCLAIGAKKVYDQFSQALSSTELVSWMEDSCDGAVDWKTTGCQGLCARGILVKIEPLNVLYHGVTPDHVQDIVDRTVRKGQIIDELLYRKEDGTLCRNEEDIPFYRWQNKIALANCGTIDPENIDEYIAYDGYRALAQSLQSLPQDICRLVLDCGLRGRGGGGFPTGQKWEFARQAEGKQKYVVCNGDEGDPGAFMDRSLMEGDPHSILEGMAVAGFATGADTGYIYVRAEYPLAVLRLKKAVDDAERLGLLGENILNSGFSFHIRIKEGAGAFVCGEETALLASIEGERGMPRPKPPFPAQQGLWGCPTTINNVETLANVPYLCRHPQAYKEIGTEGNQGTKVFALAGQIRNSGLVEVPLGITLRQVIEEVGGGIPGGKSFKGVQIGGPSGGCLTREHLDMPLDYDSLASLGAMIGSGGLVVMDESVCMVEVARFFMDFTQNESCGKCVPCRGGTRRMQEILEGIVAGRGRREDLEILWEIGGMLKDSSFCGLGKTAANPVLSTSQYFPEEYRAHIEDRQCPAGVCKELIVLKVNAQCKGCGICKKVCPLGAITGSAKTQHIIDVTLCNTCGACMEKCPFDAIEEVC